MPQRKTAQKELRKNAKRRQWNLAAKDKIKAVLKKFKKASESGDADTQSKALKEAYKVLDRAASKLVIHPNKAARKKSRLSKKLAKAKSQTA